ncbi:MAG: ATP-grasp domain-containing protein [Rhodospirillaceae bacterium]|nr:ATP-grasp domain-containing protein [Rhodospirillaceae bacterium]
MRLCKNAGEVKEQADLIFGLGSYMHITLEPSILIEEYIDGPEFSVEIMDSLIIGITKKHLGPPPYFVEIGHDFPADISVDLADQISKIVIKALKKIGLTWGAAHVKFVPIVMAHVLWKLILELPETASQNLLN